LFHRAGRSLSAELDYTCSFIFFYTVARTASTRLEANRNAEPVSYFTLQQPNLGWKAQLTLKRNHTVLQQDQFKGQRHELLRSAEHIDSMGI
jgi:hypothetical protein